MGRGSKNLDFDPSTPGSPTSEGGFSTDRIPPTSSSRHRSSTQSVSDEAEVDPDIFGEDPGDEEDDEGEYEMYNVQGTLREWVTRGEVRRFIAKKFR